MSQKQYKISAAAAHAARVILKNFTLTPRADIEPTERNVAIIVDVCTQVFRIELVLDQFVREVPWTDRGELQRNIRTLQEAVRAVEVVRNRMPHFGRSLIVSEEQKERVDSMLSSHDQQRRMDMVRSLAQASTLSDRRRILEAADTAF